MADQTPVRLPFKSYLQPLIVMSAIPFGLIGAILGHALLGLEASIMSMLGLVALAGVVVNDNLVLVDYINQQRRSGTPLQQAVHDAGIRRFRPILLTTLTTCAGLTPLLLERSVQARFLIPMAVSLAFGVLFATLISLVLVPSGYLVLEDLRRGVAWLFGRGRVAAEAGAVGESPA
jgi:multidrug efflux pump subunit AcrB